MNWHEPDDVLYFEYTPLTVEYDPQLDAFTIARADLRSSGRRHRLTLQVVVANREIDLERLSLAAAIVRGRELLDRLIEDHRPRADRLTEDRVYVFELSGRRLR